MTALKSYDPSNGELIGEIKVTDERELSEIAVKAKKAMKKWRQIPIDERISYIRKGYEKADSKVNDLSELLSREMGKDIRRSFSEVKSSIASGPYIAESAAEALKPKDMINSVIEYVPYGTVAVISPWNYPLAMANNLIIPALIAGNSVIWKPSEETPLVAQSFYEIVKDELPCDILQIVHGDGETGKKLVESDVQMIAFTGSQNAGRDIMRRSADSIKRLVMELGGNDPMIVMENADIDAAASFAVASSFENAGQMCISTERIYVDEKIADLFEKRVVETASMYRVGPWNMEGVNIGPIINKKQHENIVDHIMDAVNKGAEILLGGTSHEFPYIKPTVISKMTPDMKIEKEETFGPIVCISRYSDIDEAVKRANDSTYGLGAVVFGGDGARDIADKMEAGMIGINQGVGGSPWVGAKQSGFGFHGTKEGHRQFAQVRVTNIR